MSPNSPTAPAPPTTAAGDRPATFARCHPVTAFVGVLVLAAAALALVRWSGAVNPWVASRDTAVSDDGSRAVVEVGLHNHGRLPVEVDRLTLEGPSAADAEVFLHAEGTAVDRAVVPVPGWEAAYEATDRFTLPGGGERRVLVVLPGGCDHLMEPLDLTARVETALGRRRTVTVTTLDPWTAGHDLTDDVPPC